MAHAPLSVIVVTRSARTGRRCVDSLRQSLGPRDQVLVVCEDAEGAPGRAECVAVPEGSSLGAYRRAGLAAAHHDLVVLVDGDTVAPRFALDALVDPLTDPAFAATGPVGDLGLGHQQVTAPPHALADEKALREHVADWREAHRGEVWEQEEIGEAVIAARRSSLLNADLGPGLGGRLAGEGRLVVVGEIFWHHVAATDCALSAAESPLLGAAYIVKDEEEMLGASLDSVLPFVDEVVVYDTGSTDATLQIAAERGVKVVRGYWNDHFAEARNRALAHCTSTWVLSIDADELATGDPGVLREELTAARTAMYGVVVKNQTAGGVSSGPGSVIQRLVLRDRIVWLSRLHEFPADKAGLVLHQQQAPGLTLVHRGYLPNVVEARGKRQRNLAMARLQLQDSDRFFEVGRAELNLARSAIYAGDHAVARDAAESLLAIADLPDRVRRQALSVAVEACIHLGAFDAGWAYLDDYRALCQRPTRADQLAARLLAGEGRDDEAIQLIRRLPELDRDDDDIEVRRTDVLGVELALLSRQGMAPQAAQRLLTVAGNGASDLELHQTLDFLARAGLGADQLASAACPQVDLVLLYQTALAPPEDADAYLEARWTLKPGDPAVLAAAARAAARLPVLRALEWSARLREHGHSESCPLVRLAGDEARSPRDRVLAAAVAVELYADERAMPLLQAAAGAVPDAQSEQVLSELSVLAPQVATLVSAD